VVERESEGQRIWSKHIVRMYVKVIEKTIFKEMQDRLK
jgi:hypothetical protein